MLPMQRVWVRSLLGELKIPHAMRIYIYIYMYVCIYVCVCVCVYKEF